MVEKDPKVTMEGVTIIFRNFAGREGMYNQEGDRNFAVLLDDETASAMTEDGWHVKYLKPRDEDESPQAYLPVALKYRRRDGKSVVAPPRINLITSRGRTPLDEDMVEMLDYADITTVDLTIRPSYWEVQGKTGVKAYLQTMFVTINEDPLDQKYADTEPIEE